ncbi:MAG: hypothetical protein AABY74_09690, partial [Planctomycetota bacterium]
MAFWKRKKKEKESQDNLQDKEVVNAEEDKAFSAEVIEKTVVNEETKQELPVSEILPEAKTDEPTVSEISEGVILRGKKINGIFGKGLWGTLSILILPPVLAFALSILIVVAALTFPLMAVVLVA